MAHMPGPAMDGPGPGEVENGKIDRRNNSQSYDGPVDEKFGEYVGALLLEVERLDTEQFPLIHKLCINELSNIAKGACGVGQDCGLIDLYTDSPITLCVKAVPPVKVFPKFNYAGRIIGPKGAYLKALMKETMTKMVLLGKGVMKDKEKEDELRNTNDPKYFHLNEDMHVAIQVTAPAAEAHARVAYALKCLKQQVLSDNRGLEDLPWIATLGNPFNNPQKEMMSKEHHPAQRYSAPPPNRGNYLPRRPAPPPPPPADYGEEVYRYAHHPEYMREPLQHPQAPKAPYYAAYSRPPPRPAPTSTESRAMEFIEKARRNTEPREYSAPPRPTSYDYGHGQVGYDPEPSQHYYEDSPVTGYAAADPYAPKMTDRATKPGWLSAPPQRYSPYTPAKKF